MMNRTKFKPIGKSKQLDLIYLFDSEGKSKHWFTKEEWLKVETFMDLVVKGKI